MSAASGAINLAYIEIDAGPYLVQPSAKASDNGERLLSIEAGNLVWLDGGDVGFIPAGDRSCRVETAYLWDNAGTGERASLVRLPHGYAGQIATGAATLRAVTATDGISYASLTMQQAATLTKGSYFGSSGRASHRIGCSAKPSCVLYLRTAGAISFVD